MESMEEINTIWGPIRSLLQNQFTFGEIKEIVGLAGLDLTSLSHLAQKAGGGASKGQLMTGVDKTYGSMEESDKRRFLTIATEEILRRCPHLVGSLKDNLSRLGWTVHNGSVVPLKLFDLSELPELPAEAHPDLLKATTRLRDGDLSGAISAACGAVDKVTTMIYSEKSLGDPQRVSFQERVKKSIVARGVIPSLDEDLRALGWEQGKIKLFKESLIKSLNQAAYVMQTLRSQMGDVHGTKPILKALVFDSLKWAALIVRLLNRG